MRLAWFTLVLVTFAAESRAGSPPGRAWAPTATLTLPAAAPSFSSIVRDADGRPALVGGLKANGAPTYTWAVLAWHDSAWVDSIASAQEMAGTYPQLLDGPDGKRTFVAFSKNMDRDGYYRLALWPLGTNFSAPETVAVTTAQLGTFSFSAAFTPTRRVVSRCEQRPGETFQVKTYVSDANGPWTPVARLGSEEWNCALTDLADGSFLMVYYGLSGSWWTRLVGTQWTPVQSFPRAATGPRFMRGPSGEHWLVSANRAAPHIDAWNGAGWTPVTQFEAQRDPGRGSADVGWVEASLESGIRPAVAWQENWADGMVWRSAAHVAWPTPTGWTPGYQVPESDDMYLGPAVTQDRNGDVWLVWGTRSSGQKWTHSYVTATSTAPVLNSTPGGIEVDWRLSESAPGSWWAILRDPGSGAFEEIARVEAGEEYVLSWIDEHLPPPASAPVRYQVRRESVDARYVWHSPVTTLGVLATPAAESSSLRLLAVPNPVRAATSIELSSSSPGPVDIVLRDVAGRRVSSLRVMANGSVQTVPMDLSACAQGVYFVTARDAAGRTSPALKLVRLD